MAVLVHADKIAQSTTFSSGYRAIKADFGSGYSQVVKSGINDKDEQVNISWRGITAAERNDIINFFDALGAHTHFDWQPPNSTYSKKWRLDPNSSSYSEQTATGNHYDLSVQVSRVYV